jgi:hypothetical protein
VVSIAITVHTTDLCYGTVQPGKQWAPEDIGITLLRHIYNQLPQHQNPTPHYSQLIIKFKLQRQKQ